MNVGSNVESLGEKHSQLDQAITDEYQRPSPDSVKLSELKREKLRLKDEIARIKAQ